MKTMSEKTELDGLTFAEDCKIHYTNPVPVISNFDQGLPIGTATVNDDGTATLHIDRGALNDETHDVASVKDAHISFDVLKATGRDGILTIQEIKLWSFSI